MEFRVVCISRTLAAGGESIGKMAARRLGFRYVDEEIITRAAQEAHVDPSLVAAAEHRQPFLERLIERLDAALEVVGAPVSVLNGTPLDVAAAAPGGQRVPPDDLRALIRAAIYEVAEAGQAVIVAHAASLALGGMEGVLRVLVTASPRTRAQRLAAAQAISIDAAADAVAASDHERRDYLESFYSVKHELPTRYDLVVNTDVLTQQQVVDLILAVTQISSVA